MEIKMKISILTATYNRANLLAQLYSSIINNAKYISDIEWLIMDDGSRDNTKQEVEKFINEKKIDVKYYYQENSGKMTAINNLVEKATGKLIIECDSDDYFTDNAFEIIKNAFEKSKDNRNLYAMCFLKYDLNGNNIGKNFKKNETTMFDLYFKERENGEKALVYFANIRKQYIYKLEKQEKFITEARLHHEMDLKYKIACYNEPIMNCEYQTDGYTKNIKKVFSENPYGYYEYFKEILKRNMSGVIFKKRLYVIKHYILFSVLTNQKMQLSNVKDLYNRILLVLLWIPGKIKSMKFKNYKNKIENNKRSN